MSSIKTIINKIKKLIGVKKWSKWTTEIIVNGPIKVDNPISFKSRKDIEHGDPLMSNIKIKNYLNGVKLEVDSYAYKIEYGKEAAYLFSGLALDVLSFRTDLPLYVDLYEQKNKINYDNQGIKRIITKNEWKKAFEEARLLTFTESTFLRALGWYRKGKLSQEPSDKFLAFWNSIEVVSTKYHAKTLEAKSGTKNQIWQSFVDLWGEPKDWKVITGQIKWINENNEIRLSVAHGLLEINVRSLKQIKTKLKVIEELAYQFLSDWRQKKLNPERLINEQNRDKIYDNNWIKME